MTAKTIGVMDENGSALVVALLILVATLILGLVATNTTMNELQISGNDIVQKKEFYEADGGTEYGAQLLEENIACSGFKEDATSTGKAAIGDVEVEQLAFWANELKDVSASPSDPDPLDTRAFYFPVGATDTVPHTEVFLAGKTGYLKGSAMQLAAGYEGVGEGSAGSGVQMGYDLISERHVNGKPGAAVTIGWRHVVGQEEDCKFK